MKSYNVILSDSAKIDLQNIVSYINNVESFSRSRYVEARIFHTAQNPDKLIHTVF